MAGRSGTALWSPEALTDLDEIWNYYERVAGRDTAEKIVREIAEVIATIEHHPLPDGRGMSCGPVSGRSPPTLTWSSIGWSMMRPRSSASSTGGRISMKFLRNRFYHAASP